MTSATQLMLYVAIAGFVAAILFASSTQHPTHGLHNNWEIITLKGG